MNMTGAKIATDAKDWDAFKSEWRAIFQEQAAAAGVPFEWQEGEPRAMGQPGTLLSVHVDDYRYVGTGARIFFGVMTGNAYINAQARFTDLRSGGARGPAQEARLNSSTAFVPPNANELLTAA